VPSGYIIAASAHYHAKLRFFCRLSIANNASKPKTCRTRRLQGRPEGTLPVDSHRRVSLHDYIAGMFARLGDIVGKLHMQ